MEILLQIGKAIVNRRKSLNVSQEELAKATGVSRHYLSDIENGTRAVSVPVIKTLANHLRWTLTDLFSTIEPEASLRIIPIEDQNVLTSTMKLGMTITRMRENENISLERFAEILCMNENRVKEIESGACNITYLELERISLVLRSTISNLVRNSQVM